MDNQVQVNIQPRTTEVLSLEDAAPHLGIGPKALRLWLNDHQEIRGQYCFKDKYFNEKKNVYRRQTVIRVEALLIIANMRDGGRGNQFGKGMLSTSFVGKKKEMAETAIEQVALNRFMERQQQSIDTQNKMMERLLVLLEEKNKPQLPPSVQIDKAMDEKMIQQVLSLDSRVAEIEGDTSKIKLSTGQRERLNERIRFLSIQLEEPFWKVWIRLHEVTGRRAVGEYMFEDYETAITWLKKEYRENSINW
jgi:hypothetical protein